MRNQLFIIITGLLIFSACGAPAPQENEGPKDLAGLQNEKRELQKQLQEIGKKLEETEAKIVELDPSLAKSAILVTTDTMTKVEFKHFVNMQSTIQSEDVAKLSSEMGGRITSIPVKEGQYVRRGQLLAKVDASQLEKSLAELETSLSLARDVYERQKRLWDQNIGSEIQYLEAKNGVERLEKSKESLKNQMAKTNIYAPLNGVVDQIMNEVGELAAPGFPVLQVTDVRRLKVVADLPENYLLAVKRGEKVDIHVPAIDKTISGKINLVGQTIDPSNRTFKVEAKINNEGGVLKPNLLADMKINDYSVEDVIVLSADLVQQEVGGKNFVYVAQKEGDQWFAQKRYITLGQSGDNQLVIKSGLKENEIVIVEGSLSLNDGAEVKFGSTSKEG